MVSTSDSGTSESRRPRATTCCQPTRVRIMPRPVLPTPISPSSETSQSRRTPRAPLPTVRVTVFPKSSRPQGKKKKVQDAAPPASPRHRMTKKAPHAYTAREKLYWLDILDTQPDLSIQGLARLANVQPKQIREWRKLKERLLVSVACRRRLVGAGRNLKKPPAELVLKWIDEAWADVPEEMDSREVEVLEDVMEEEQDELVPNPFYPAPVVTPPDVTIEMEEEAVLAAEAEEADEEAVPAKSDSSESDDGNANEADEWSDEGDEWWAPGRYEGAEVDEWVAGDEDE
ncbi:unnamed protein product [Closterium sp. NIES-54]